MNYGDCEYGTTGGIYGNLCPNVAHTGIAAAALGPKRFTDDDEAIAVLMSLLT